MGEITGPIRNPQNARFHWYISPTFFGFDHSRLLVGPSRPASFLSDSNICCFLEILSSTPHSVYILEAFQNAQGLHLVMMEYDGSYMTDSQKCAYGRRARHQPPVHTQAKGHLVAHATLQSGDELDSRLS